jgi:hypothetical protein
MGKIYLMIRKMIFFMFLITVTFLMVSCQNKNLEEKQDELSVELSKPTKLGFYFVGNEPRDYRLVSDEVEKRINSTLNISLDFKWLSADNYLEEIKRVVNTGLECDAFITGKQTQGSIDMLFNLIRH